MVVTLGQQYNVGERPTLILYTLINRHAGPPNTTNTKDYTLHNKKVVIIYDSIGLGLSTVKCRGEPTVILYIQIHHRTGSVRVVLIEVIKEN